jgi:hypothetical protein
VAEGEHRPYLCEGARRAIRFGAMGDVDLLFLSLATNHVVDRLLDRTAIRIRHDRVREKRITQVGAWAS